MKKRILTLIAALATMLALGIGTAGAASAATPAEVCAGYGLDNYVLRGTTLMCYDAWSSSARDMTWVVVRYP